MKIGTLISKDDILQGLPQGTIPQIANTGIDFVVINMDTDSNIEILGWPVWEIEDNHLEQNLIFSPTWRRELARLDFILETVQRYQIPRVFVRVYETLGPSPEEIAEELTKFLADVGFPVKICIYGALASPNMPKTMLGQVFKGLKDRIGTDNLYFSPLLSWKTLSQPKTRGHKQVPGVFVNACTSEELEITLKTLGQGYEEVFLFPYTTILGKIVKESGESAEIGNAPPAAKIWKMECLRSTAIRSSPSMGASIHGRILEGDIVELLEAPIEFGRQEFGRIGENSWVVIKIGLDDYLEEVK